MTTRQWCVVRAQWFTACAVGVMAMAGCGKDGGHSPEKPDGAMPDSDSGMVHDDGGTVPGTWWKPTADKPIHWAWQLDEAFEVPGDILPHITVYDIDGEEATKEDVAALHALGPNVKVICYFDAGVYEDYRTDKQMFIDAGLTDGPDDEGWPGSKWIDIRKLDKLMPILKHRVEDWCVAKGFDAIEPDETEVWSNWNETESDKITKAENNAFNKAVADLAHEYGLSVGLKGNNTEAGELEQYFDWALTEECYNYEECDNFEDSFIAKNKAVFNVEYDDQFSDGSQCAAANAAHINSVFRDLDVRGPQENGYIYEPCVPDDVDAWP